MSKAQNQLVWVELLSTDVAASKAFYSRVVGWDMQDVPMPGMTYTLLLSGAVQTGGLMAMPQDASAAGMKPFWSVYIEVPEVEAAMAKIVQLGGAVYKTAQDIPNVGRFAVVADPQGAVFNVFTPLTSAPHGVSHIPGQVGWYEMHAQDWAKSFDFYSSMFGWQKGDIVDMGPMGAYQLFTIDGVPSGGIFNSPAAAHARFWLIYFSVAGIEAAAERIKEAGGTIMMGPHEVPGGGWIVQGSDPQGTMFALTGPKN